MEAFKVVTGKAAPMMGAHIDTDVIMPKQFLKGIDRQGLDKGLFYDLRFSSDGQANPDFILNKPAWQPTTFLVVGPNFGCGSSREHAVWGMKQLGIRALIGTSFAGIFNDNCQRNGVLTLCLTEDDIKKIVAVALDAKNNILTIDLPNDKIILDNDEVKFEIDGLKKYTLIEGLDAIGYTLQYKDDIEKFEQRHFSGKPWYAM